MGSFHLFVHPKWSKSILGKNTYFDPVLTDFGFQNSRFSTHVVLGIFLGKHIFDPFLVAKQPNFKAFCDFGGAKMACNGLKMGSFHSRIISDALGSFLEKHIFDPFFTHF